MQQNIFSTKMNNRDGMLLPQAIGSKISLISKFLVRYEGILDFINSKKIILTNVVIMGTEGRVKEPTHQEPNKIVKKPIPKQNRVYKRIQFNSDDILELKLVPMDLFSFLGSPLFSYFEKASITNQNFFQSNPQVYPRNGKENSNTNKFSMFEMQRQTLQFDKEMEERKKENLREQERNEIQNYDPKFSFYDNLSNSNEKNNEENRSYESYLKIKKANEEKDIETFGEIESYGHHFHKRKTPTKRTYKRKPRFTSSSSPNKFTNRSYNGYHSQHFHHHHGYQGYRKRNNFHQRNETNYYRYSNYNRGYQGYHHSYDHHPEYTFSYHKTDDLKRQNTEESSQ